MQPLRILIVQETNWIDRNVIQQHHLAERLVRRGHHVEVIDYDILWRTRPHRPLWRPRQVFPAVSKIFGDANVCVTRPATAQVPLLDSASWTVTSLLELRRQVVARRPDVVIGLTLTNSQLMSFLLRRWQVPYVSMVQEPYHTMVPQRWLWPVARVVERLALRRADRVAIFTPQMQRYLGGMGVKAERIALFKTGVSLGLFHPAVDGTARRQELGIGPDEWVLLFMGWLYDFSGLREITRAIGENPSVLNGARFLIVGDGDINQELRGLIGHHGIGEHVIMAGKRPYDQIPGWVAAANVCMLPSVLNDTTREIVPMKVYEYLAAGRPVVASDLPGLRAEFGDEGGVLYADGPLDALHEAVALADQPARVAELSRAGRRMAELNADWDRSAATFEEMLQQLVGSYPRKAHG